ncbi:flagellar hook capping FlgD N-terminal domain-containing protein [Vallitalea guaymasensis]|uniref:flagellar hook capping FlgD N-terminal domain-containing protein n=1 Tax=Vallitalea guaymasensis TaxID=1185412 RepID=UPI000DE2C717|nr:flagellar hook capping FlgD N-terminal domain-containing protein [Vallitalea guaymasensis]
MADISNTNTQSNVVKDIMDKYGIDTMKTSKKTNDLDKDAFLNLLVTQMRYQDPLNPTQDKDFLAQMAQFSALEQMQNLNTSASMSRAYELMNKDIFANIVNPVSLEITPVAGTVRGVFMQNGKVFLKVGDVDVPLEKVEGVLAPIDLLELNKKVEEISKDIAKIQEKYAPGEDDDSDEDESDEADKAKETK